MICPYCGYENIDGVDTCANCTQDLSALDEPSGETPIEDTMIHRPLSRLGPKEAVMVAPETTIKQTIDTLCERNIGCVLVGTPDSIDGIFSERDVLLKLAHRMDRVASTPVSEFMTRDPEMLEGDAPIAFALNRMSLGDFRHLPVTNRGKLEGIISLRDFLAFLGEWYPDLVSAKSGN